jgi:hypothetical protein
MIAQVEVSSKPRFLRRGSVGLPGVLQGCSALLVVTIGVLSLIEDLHARRVLESWINIHVLFALTLLVLLVARYQACVKCGAPLLRADIHALSRQLSRFVYLLIYAVIGIRQCMSIAGGLWNGGALSSPADLAGLDLKGDFPLLLLTTLLALAVVRVMAFRLLSSART